MSDQEDDYEDRRHEPEKDETFEDSSEEDEEEDEDKYEQDDFIVGDDDDDEGSAPEPEPDPEEHLSRRKKKKKKRRYREDSPELAEGDLQLLEDEGVRVDRKKKLRRLRKGASDEELDELDEDLRNLAQDTEDDREREPRSRADDPVDYDDDMDDFIDDGGRSKRKRSSGHVSSKAVLQARSIFGDVDEMNQYKGGDQLLQREDGAGDLDDETYQEDGEVEATGLRRIRHRDTDLEDGDDDQMPPERTVHDQDGAIAQELTARGDVTEEVQIILNTDVPERLQLHFGRNYSVPTEDELRQEARWVHSKGFRDSPDFAGEVFATDDLLQKINICLSYIHIDKLDVPFISMYRKDYISDLLVPAAGEFFRDDRVAKPEDVPMPPPRGFNTIFSGESRPGILPEYMRGVPRGYDDGFGDWSVVWTILDLDKQFAELSRRRKGLLADLRRSEEKGVPTLVIEDVRMMAELTEEENELKDGERYLRLASELAESQDKNQSKQIDAEETSKRPARRRNRYSEFCKRGYRLLAREFGISARQFGENFKGTVEFGTGTQMHVPFESESDPLETAQLFAIRTGGSRTNDPDIDKQTAERMLSAARFILATEIFSDMQVVGMTRKILTERNCVSVSTTPTPQGISQVTESHPLRCVTSIKQRPLERFDTSVDFALICRAEELGYTVLDIEFQEEKLLDVKKNLTTSIVVDSETSENVKEWNRQRVAIVEEVHAMLVRHIREEIRKKLTERAAANLRNQLTRAASRRLMLGPGRPRTDEDGVPRVLAFYVTREEDEEPDPLQDRKDLEARKESKSSSSDRRLAHERVTIVDLDENGEYSNAYEIFAAWLRRPQRNVPESQLPNEVKEQLKSFILRARAQMIVVGVGSGGRAAVRLHQDLMGLIKELVCAAPGADEDAPRLNMLTPREAEKVREEGLQADPQEGHTDAILSKYIALVDDFPARIFAKTSWSTTGLPVDDMTILEKRTIGLGRLAQEPLWVYSAIAMEKEASSHLRFHPFHYYASTDDRRTAFHRALIRAICSVGVDINRCLRLPHMQSMVPFVGGLGPHKGKALIDALCEKLSDDDRGLLSRKHLWSRDFVGRTVFLSAAAFLRVRDPELHPGGSTRRAVEVRRAKLTRKGRGRRRDEERHVIFDPMDDSRVHPEHYTVAHKIADESLRDDQGRLMLDIPDQDEFSEQLRMTAAVLDRPEELNKLALDDYATHLQQLGRGSLFETVRMIAAEYKGPFKDFRRPLVSPGHEALFYIITGADPLAVRQGSAVTATNCQVRMKARQNIVVGISCMLPHGIRGFIPAGQFSDEQELETEQFRHLVPDGSSLRCRITDFVFHKFEARLTSKLSLLHDPTPIRGYLPAVDFTDPTIQSYPAKEEDESKSLGGLQSANSSGSHRGMNRHETVKKLKELSKSVLQHQKFKDISGQQANGILRSALPGDILIRPSQYHQNELVFSGKFSDIPGQPNRGVIHIPCKVMEDAEHAPNSRLKIGNSIFEHVDQVIEEFVRPIISNLTETMDHRKFQHGTVDDLKKLVSKEKFANPQLNPYFFGLSERRMTSIVLLYIPGSKTVKTEEVDVMPDGFRFRGTLHMSLNALITYFKKNMMASSIPSRPSTVQRERPGASPFRPPAESPFHHVASPFTAAQSPFHAVPQPAPSAARQPFNDRAGRVMAQPAADVPPPPAPAGANMPDGGRRPRYDGPVDWGNATRQSDEPPPGMHNGAFNGRNGMHGPSERGVGRGMEVRHGHDGPGNKGPPDRGAGRGAVGNMPSWRGQAPIPAWKKQQQQQGQ